jgi:tetratricopeptide (TPR) repeat protein
MRKIIVTILIFFSLFVRAQNEQLAQNYFDRGEFEKALVSYEDLLKSQPGNMIYFQKTIDCYQQLQQFDKAEKGIQERLDKFKQANLLVELGYNYQLQKTLKRQEILRSSYR